MKYLITGGAGFIGSHLTESLLADGHEVLILDDLSTGAVNNLQAVRTNPRLRLIADDVFNTHLTAELVDEADAVFHLAASVGVFQIVESPVRTIENNIRGTEIILSKAAKKRKPVLMTSTSEVYGKASKIPFSEDDDCVLGPSSKGRWSYAASKLVDEFLALSYFRERGLPAVVVRLFNTVGPRQSGRYGMVLPRFVRQALSKEPITIFGDGTQSRCFCDVSDVVGALRKLIHESNAYGQVFNVGNDQETSISDLANLVRARASSTSPFKHISYKDAYGFGFEDMQRRVPDLSKVGKLIGYRPKVTLTEIVDRVIGHERSLKS